MSFRKIVPVPAKPRKQIRHKKVRHLAKRAK
jgi:hypothetical protein